MSFDDSEVGTSVVGTELRRKLSRKLTSSAGLPQLSAVPGNSVQLRGRGADASPGSSPARGVRAARAFSSVFGATVFDKDAFKKGGNVVIFGILQFKKQVSLREVQTTLVGRLCEIPRFCSIPVNMAAEGQKMKIGFQEVDMAQIDTMRDKLVLEKPEIKSKGQLDAYVSKLYSMEWANDLPLWRLVVLNSMDDGLSRLLVVIHHSLADGVACVQVLMSVLDDPSSTASVATRSTKGPTVGCFAVLKGWMQACWGPFCGDMLPGDPSNRLKTKDPRNPGKTKACAMTEALTLDTVKAVKNKLGGTINDVLMTVTAMTLQAYYKKYDEKALKQKVRANFPINMRKVKGDDILLEEHFGNRFSQGQLRFPLNQADPLKIYAAIKQQIDVIKVSPEPMVRDKVTSCLALKSGLGWNTVYDALLDAFGKTTAMLSNVPGPLETVKLLGQDLDDLSFYAMAPIGLYFGIVQYKGIFKAGICCDASCEPEPAKLAECWAPAFQALHAAAMAS